ncbi:hypothetical protein BDW02DRAFT_483763, partial [Decorospora gaudefroyi]
MYLSTLLATIFLIATALASPHAWAAPQAATVVPTPVKSNRTHRHHHHHKERTPTFKQPCNCQMPIIPVRILTENERCLMKHAAQMGCYMSSKGGCPSPAPACGLGPLP